MKKDLRRVYHKRYYRIKSLARLRKKIKDLESTLNIFMSSPEGQEYLRRKKIEYQRDYRENNKEKIREYQKEYHRVYATL